MRQYGITFGGDGCECHKCIKEKGIMVSDDILGDIPLSSCKMILCGECGNKRCPKASDHENDCTNSNDSGQPGSLY